MKRAVAFALAGALALGCSQSEPAPAERAGTATVPLQPGEVRIHGSGDRVTVMAQGAPRLEVLLQLASLVGFTVARGEGRPAARVLDLTLREVTVEEALAVILYGVPHQRRYDFPPDAAAIPEPWSGGRTALLSVTVGRPVQTAIPAPIPPAPAPPAGSEPAPVPPARFTTPRDLSGFDLEDRERHIEESWQHPDPVVRLEAIALMAPEGEDLPKLVELLSEDPDPLVRAAAAEELGDGEGFDTAPALMLALDDGEPAVVVASIEALEDLFDDHPDPEIRARVATLREHPDEDVREAVASFEEWVED